MVCHGRLYFANTPLSSPAVMLKPEADIILAIQHLHSQMDHTTIDCRHVYGHQDTRKRPSGSVVETRDTMLGAQPTLTNAAEINVECDRLATETSNIILGDPDVSHMPPVMTPPYPGSRAGLWINGVWITSHLHAHVHQAHHFTAIREYCMTKYGWSDTTFDSINWQAIRKARQRGTATQMMRSCKILHGWMPVMHMHGHTTGNTQCPGCSCSDETFDHFLRCPNTFLSAARRTALATLRQKCKGMKIHRDFSNVFCSMVEAFFLGTDIPDTPHRTLHLAILSQKKIGLEHVVQGFIALDWKAALKESGAQGAEGKMATLVQYLWNDVIGPLWTARNDILHRAANYTTTLEHDQLGQRLQWYHENRSVLDRRDHFLARFGAQDIPGMLMAVRREWIRHLDSARAAYEIETSQPMVGQRVLTQYILISKRVSSADALG